MNSSLKASSGNLLSQETLTPSMDQEIKSLQVEIRATTEQARINTSVVMKEQFDQLSRDVAEFAERFKNLPAALTAESASIKNREAIEMVKAKLEQEEKNHGGLEQAIRELRDILARPAADSISEKTNILTKLHALEEILLENKKHKIAHFERISSNDSNGNKSWSVPSVSAESEAQRITAKINEISKKRTSVKASK